jgi:hypothetical protein
MEWLNDRRLRTFWMVAKHGGSAAAGRERLFH